MRLSDVKGERTFDVLADVFDSVCVMVKDKRVLQAFRKRTLPKGMTEGQLGVQVAMDAATVIVKYHKNECIKIMSSIEGVSEAEYLENVDGIKLIQDVLDLIMDPQLQTLFFSPMAISGSDSGPATGNTEGKQA